METSMQREESLEVLKEEAHILRTDATAAGLISTASTGARPKNTFVGREVVDWLVKTSKCESRQMACDLMNQLMEARYVASNAGEPSFRDTGISYYHFLDTEDSISTSPPGSRDPWLHRRKDDARGPPGFDRAVGSRTRSEGGEIGPRSKSSGEPSSYTSIAAWLSAPRSASVSSPPLFNVADLMEPDTPPIRVNIESHETRTDSHGRYSVYRIVVRNGLRSWTVDRRYSEFHSLHQTLSQLIPAGTDMPRLPPKRYLGTLTKGFVENRAHALNEYLQALVIIPAIWRIQEAVAFFDDPSSSLTMHVTLQRLQQQVQALQQQCTDNNRQLQRYEQLVRRQQRAMDVLHGRVLALEAAAMTGMPAAMPAPSESIMMEDADTPASGPGSAVSRAGPSVRSAPAVQPVHERPRAIAVNHAAAGAGNADDPSGSYMGVATADAVLASPSSLDPSGFLSGNGLPWAPQDKAGGSPWADRHSVGFSLVQGSLDDSVIPVNLEPTAVDRRVDAIVFSMCPKPEAQASRDRVLKFVTAMLKKALGAQAFPIGYYPLGCFLPEDVLGVSAFLCLGQEKKWFVKVNEVLCVASSEEGVDSSTFGGGMLDVPVVDVLGTGSAGTSSADHVSCTVGAVHFVNTPDRRIQCRVDDVMVDISANSVADLTTVALVEEVDRRVGRDHLFKRSLMLVKAWSSYESQAYSGSSAMASLMWRAVVTLLVWVFVRRLSVIHQPLQALAWLLFDCARFNWSQQVVTVFGPVNVADVTAAGTADLPINALNDAISLVPDMDDSQPIAPPPAVDVNTAVTAAHLASVLPVHMLVQARERVDRRMTVGGTAGTGMPFNAAADGKTADSDDEGSSPEDLSDGLVPGFQDPSTASLLQQPPPPPAEKFVVGAMNVADVLRPTLNVCEGVTADIASRIHTLFSMGAKTMQPLLQHVRTCEPADAPGAASSSTRTSLALLDSFFSASCQKYDLKQSGRAEQGRTFSDAFHPSFECFDVDLDTIKRSVDYGLFVLDAAVTSSALLTLAAEILYDKGRLPVGEIGKLLQEATANASLSATLKDKFGGLKKFLENYPNVFYISNDHPFNPHVYLRQNLTDEDIESIEKGGTPASIAAANARKKKPSRRKKSSATVAPSGTGPVASTGMPGMPAAPSTRPTPVGMAPVSSVPITATRPGPYGAAPSMPTGMPSYVQAVGQGPARAPPAVGGSMFYPLGAGRGPVARAPNPDAPVFIPGAR